MRELGWEDVEFTVECEPEIEPTRGNVCCCGDPGCGAESWVLEQLEQGNMWAWCTVTVKASWHGITGWDVLGCCSYQSEADFIENSGYMECMKLSALEHLNSELARYAELVSELQEV